MSQDVNERVAKVNERVRGTLSLVKGQIGLLEEKFEQLEKKAKDELQQLDKVKLSVADLKAELKGAFDNTAQRLRSAFDYVRSDDLRRVSERLDDLAAKVEKLLRTDKIRKAVKDKVAKSA